MYSDFSVFLFVIFIFLPRQSIQENSDQVHLFRKIRSISSFDIDQADNSTSDGSTNFFQNEPIPLPSSLVDDLTTLASAVYIISFIIVIFLLLAWITHYNAPCSSLITSALSKITGLPESIVHSVALCGACCVLCEKTWLFRRIHQFNIWMSNKITQFLSGTCKVLYDTICPCCRPPDTPSNRSIIGSLPASIIAMIHVSDISLLTPSRPTVTVVEPIPVSSNPITVEPRLENQKPSSSSATPPESNVVIHEIDANKLKRTNSSNQSYRKTPRK
ncbi:unnamed protein product [Adineta ricciae]|uniref:Uncharacterized protein n=1 Tax=Adineta ricciae TaxID=249248 RepID=A0A813MBU6_ADIRI|nr:unnamed protein product [Adineta ricciae]CAF1162051.1 unnamed protein product [Adineta ricciae]